MFIGRVAGTSFALRLVARQQYPTCDRRQQALAAGHRDSSTVPGAMHRDFQQLSQQCPRRVQHPAPMGYGRRPPMGRLGNRSNWRRGRGTGPRRRITGSERMNRRQMERGQDRFTSRRSRCVKLSRVWTGRGGSRRCPAVKGQMLNIGLHSVRDRCNAGTALMRRVGERQLWA